ncbi:NUDIX domain-containing protein [Streptomyces anulatus]|uniref:NUDIX domain-containing protein n=1 Tax=Streptomyces anulatus TaxID=1892 RepID=UPI003661652B
MNAAEYRAAAERIVSRDTYRFGGIHPDDLRKAEIFAQLAIAAATSETAGAHTGSDHTETFEAIRYTADVVCIRGSDVLVIERGWDPHKGMNALPGGHVDPGESSRAAAARELLEETGVQVDASDLMQVGVWDAPGRDPRGRYITAAYLVTVPDDTTTRAGDDAAAVRWVPLDAPGTLAFDHGQIVATARRQHLACGGAIGTARRA